MGTSEITIDRSIEYAVSHLSENRSLAAILRNSKKALIFSLENVDEDWQKHPELVSSDDIWDAFGVHLDENLGKYEIYLEERLSDGGFTPEQIKSIPKVGIWNEPEHEFLYHSMGDIDSRIINEDGFISRTAFLISQLRCLRSKLATAKNGKELFEWCQFIEAGLNIRQNEVSQFELYKTQENYEAGKQEIREAGNAAKREKVAGAQAVFQDDYLRHLNKEYGREFKLSNKKRTREKDVLMCMEGYDSDEKGRYIIPLKNSKYSLSLNKLIGLAKEIDRSEGVHRGGRPQGET